MQVPFDGRLQVSASAAMIANAMMGRWVTAGLEPTLDPNTYIVSGTWPRPKPTPTNSFSSAVAASTSAPEPKPRSPGQALWPNLP
jgi:hypothetical protein